MTTTTHWQTQNDRRKRFIAEWERNRRTVIRGRDVELVDTPRGTRQGVYMGRDGGNPTLQLDAVLHEVPPGTTSTIHRHSWDAIVLPLEGAGWTEIDGQRVDWRAWDGLHLPAWSWHRTGNDTGGPVRYLSFSSEPLLSVLNLAVIEDAGRTPVEELPPRPRSSPADGGGDPYSRRLARLNEVDQRRSSARVHVDYDERPLRPTPKGTRTKWLSDESIGMLTSGLTHVMIQFAPGLQQSMHRHPGEAWLYVVEGRGHTYIGTEPEGGEEHQWETGDLVVIDHWVWHQHFNDDPDSPARLVRVHSFASVLEMMRAVMHPLELFTEKLETAPQLGDIDWPEDARPGA